MVKSGFNIGSGVYVVYLHNVQILQHAYTLSVSAVRRCKLLILTLDLLVWSTIESSLSLMQLVLSLSTLTPETSALPHD